MRKRTPWRANCVLCTRCHRAVNVTEGRICKSCKKDDLYERMRDYLRKHEYEEARNPDSNDIEFCCMQCGMEMESKGHVDGCELADLLDAIDAAEKEDSR